MNILAWLRAQPSDMKTKYSFIFASVCSGIIALIWATTLPAQFAHISMQDSEKESQTNSFTNVVSETKNQLGNVVDAIQPEGDGVNQDEKNPETNIPDTQVGASASTYNLDTLRMDATDTPESVSDRTHASTTHVYATTSAIKRQEESQAHKVILIGTTTARTQ